MSETSKTAGASGHSSVNRAKLYQLVLFPLNNGATNVYYVLILSYVATFGSTVLLLGTVFASVMVTAMRVFDAITDPIIGALMDRTNGKFGKFRPFMVIGNAIMAVSVLLLYIGTPLIPESMMWLRYVMFVLLYAVWVIGYTFQTSVTRAGQTVLTNDPNQRPLFTIFNTVGSLVGMGVMQFSAPIIATGFADGYGAAEFYAVFAPVGIVISIGLTILAIIGIWEKDQPKYFGLGGSSSGEKVKSQRVRRHHQGQQPDAAPDGRRRRLQAGPVHRHQHHRPVHAVRLHDGQLRHPVSAHDGAGLCVQRPVLPADRPYQPEERPEGQPGALRHHCSGDVRGRFDPAVPVEPQRSELHVLDLSGHAVRVGFRITINPYTILFIIFFGIGYGAYYATADMPIPMVADCSDYETYRSGNYIPGIMGTLFSLVDKLVSSLSATVVGLAVSAIGLSKLPTQYTPYEDGMNVVVIVLFCVIPMIAWAATLIAMKGYTLTGARMKEIQAINACRKDAIADGMSKEEAMAKWTKVEDLPEEYRPTVKS